MVESDAMPPRKEHPWGPRAPTTPRLALSLRRLGDEVDARWPDRSRASDGWIGDQAHRQRFSDHNPDRHGVVHAIDITSAGIDVDELVAAAIAHPATHYVISRGQIWQRINHWQPREYEGTDPHRSHVHVSLMLTTAAERNRIHWLK